jgi:hypothetical protein
MCEAEHGLRITQVRRFFHHCRVIEARMKSTKFPNWISEEATFRKLDIAASDAFGERPPKIPRIFHDFIQRNVAAVHSADDFLKGFLPHFEAVIGFGARFFKERERS